MRSRTATWFICKIAYKKTMEDGLKKKVKESYVVDALSFTEAEQRIMEEMSSYISEAIEVEGISKATFKEIFFSDDNLADYWYKAKLQFITIDEKTEREKRCNATYLVNAQSLNRAIKNIDKVMGETMIDYSSIAIQETPIIDVIEYCKKDNVKPETEN